MLDFALEKNESVAEEREKACKIIGELRRKHPCVCRVHDCPFKGLCDICIRNHLEDGTLPACCLPPVYEREDVSKYPDCRTPLLWFLIDEHEFKKHLEKLSPELQEKIKASIKKLANFVS